MDLERISTIVSGAQAAGREVLLEPEGLEILKAAGFQTPYHDCIHDAREASTLDLSRFAGDRVVVKVISPDITHKSEAGGVAVVPKNAEAIATATSRMSHALSRHSIRGFLIVEYIVYDPSLGGELLFGARWTEDFGAIVTFGAGGVYTEFLAENFKVGRDVGIASALDLDRRQANNVIQDVAVARLATGALRGQAPRIDNDTLVDTLVQFAQLAEATVPEFLSEIEVNPFVIHCGQLLALDVLALCQTAIPSAVQPRPVHKLRNLLRPRSIAIVGVSERMNPGHVILSNTLRAGFARERLYVVKPDVDSIEGCTCYPDVESLPERVDLLVLSVDAAQAPALLATISRAQKAESIILITGGLDEREGSEELVSEIVSALQQARNSQWGGPIINGGNSMGIRSQPGRYDATFIPDYKHRPPAARTYPVALITQSGAYAVAKGSKLGFDTRYAITVGNQMDLTIGDYMDHLKHDPETEIFAVYAEGFRPLDGLKFLKAAREITAGGRTVILYRAGRTPDGAAAAASHTAVLAGDYSVTRALMESAGVIVCRSTEDFEGLVKLSAFLARTKVGGLRLGAMSNAGFETVAITDHLHGLALAQFSQKTEADLQAVLERHRVAGIVDVRNPLDVTPMVDDAAYEDVTRALLSDPNVDVGLIGCVPCTPALQTVPPGSGHSEDVFNAVSVAMRLARLKGEFSKPWVVVVDGGPMYDPMARLFEDHAIPTFRTADRALRLLSAYCMRRMAGPHVPRE